MPEQSDPQQGSEALDFVDLGSAEGSEPEPQTIPYDPSRDRESIRGWIALSLIGLLALVTIASFAFMWRHPGNSKELHDLLEVLYGPLIALVGAATGYYFGAHASQTKS